MGLDRGQWKTNPTLDICHLVKIATTLLVAIELNGENIEFFSWATNLGVPIAAC